MAKYAAGEASVRAVDQAVQSLGGNGLTKEYGIASVLTASRLARIAPGQPGDDPQLRRADLAGPAPVLLIVTEPSPVASLAPELVHYSVEGAAARIVLDSPHNHNALSTALVQQLRQRLRDATEERGVRVVVLGHTGKTFCAGADLARSFCWHAGR